MVEIRQSQPDLKIAMSNIRSEETSDLSSTRAENESNKPVYKAAASHMHP